MRWRVEAPYLGGVRSNNYTAEGPMTDFKAMAFVLTLAWQEYTKSHGTPCPWDFANSEVVAVGASGSSS